MLAHLFDSVPDWRFGGAGPGDPELLTLKARRALQEADVVIHDALGAALEQCRLTAGSLNQPAHYVVEKAFVG